MWQVGVQTTTAVSTYKCQQQQAPNCTQSLLVYWLTILCFCPKNQFRVFVVSLEAYSLSKWSIQILLQPGPVDRHIGHYQIQAITLEPPSFRMVDLPTDSAVN